MLQQVVDTVSNLCGACSSAHAPVLHDLLQLIQGKVADMCNPVQVI